MSDVTFGTWGAAASPLTIEYSLVVIEEIRHEVAEGFQKLSRGGIEVGGLLYGVNEGSTVRIMAIRPLACEHSSGPSFRLSERDRTALLDQIRQNPGDSRLEGLVCVGWYVSHTRTEIALAESDLEIFSAYFGQPWQVTLVIRPSRGGNMRAGFFVWEPGGTVNASQSYLEFTFPDRLAAAFDNRGSFADRKAPEHRAPRAPRPVTSSFTGPATSPGNQPGNQAGNYPVNPPVGSPITAPVTPPVIAPDRDIPRSVHSSSNLQSLFGEPAPGPSAASEAFGVTKASSAKKWILLAAAVIVIAAAVIVGARFMTSGLANETIALSVLEREGQLDIEWNRAAAPVAKAVRGTLEISDGPQPRTIPLSRAELALGRFSYKRDTGDIQVRMSVEAADGKKVQEASRFLGPPPVRENAEELTTLQKRRDELETEVTRLKQFNDQQTQRIQQLERTLKILQTRPGVQ